MKITYLYKLIISFFVISILASCDDFFDVNEDPNNPTEAAPNLLLTSAEAGIASAVGFGNGLSRLSSVFMHQAVRRGEGDQYAIFGNDFTIGATWNSFYTLALSDLESIISTETENGNLTYVGIAKILKAYSYSVIVDVWGNVPFTEANNLVDIRFPVYDEDAEIYPQLLDLLDEAISDINDEEATNTLIPAADDLIYAGNTTLWVKFANTLKFKLLYQLQDVNTITDRDAQLAALISDPSNLISAMAEDFEFWYAAPGPSPENRHGLFVSEYTQANPGFYVSPWLYETMTGQNPNFLTGITDPRVPYYWHRQLTPGEDPENPFEYLTTDGFLTIHFASTHPNQASGQQSSQTVFGLYPAGGFYDDGSGTKVSASSGNGVAPERMLPYFKVLYMQAELALAGNISGDDRQLLSDAIQASFDKVNQMVGLNGQPEVPSIDQADVDIYINNILGLYDAGTDEQKLDVILTQKWLASVGNPTDAYIDYRREGHPLLFDPNNYNGANPIFNPTTGTNLAFPLSLPWFQSDLDINPNAPSQKTVGSDGIFWDIN
ncbi:MAG: SusD/RagB family nutrient-binding outer membrane lipoprotein [Bacteroidota bacterium]